MHLTGKKRSVPEQVVWTTASLLAGDPCAATPVCWQGNGSTAQRRVLQRMPPLCGAEQQWCPLGPLASRCSVSKEGEGGCKLMSDNETTVFSFNLALCFRHGDALSSITTGRVSKHANYLLQILSFLSYLSPDNWTEKLRVAVCFMFGLF